LLGDVNDSSDNFSFRTVLNNFQTVGGHSDFLNDLLGFKAIHVVVVDVDVLINKFDGFAIVGDDVDDLVRSHLPAGKSAKFESSFGHADLAKNVPALNHKEEFYN
jgi:hypothetical protein